MDVAGSELVDDAFYKYSLMAVLCGSSDEVNAEIGGPGDVPDKAAKEDKAPLELAIDVVCCAPCQMSRQCRALEGHPKTFSTAYCLMSLFLWPTMPVCIRVMLADKFDMDEWCCTSFFKGTVCLYCSMCQTNLELERRGFPPGESCTFRLTME